MVYLLSILVLSVCSLWILAGLVAVVRVTRAGRPALGERPPVTVLKPLCGADAGLAANLETFFVQDYPAFEILLGVEDPADPAIAVAQALQAKHPEVRSQVVVHSGGRAINPKVRNLLGMLPYASHDLLLVSDSNVRAPRSYLAESVGTLRSDPRIGLVTNLFAGTGEESLGAALEAVQLNGFCAAGAALPTAVGDSLVIGKSMLFSRRTLDQLGGLGRVAAVLAEDFVIGKMFQHGGYRVALGPTVLENHIGRMTVRAFFLRHLRWGMLRWRLRPAAAIAEIVTSPIALLPLGGLALGAVGLLWIALLLVARDVGGWLALRGPRHVMIPLLLSPAREFALLLVWIVAPYKRHISWRGHRVRLGAGTLLFEQDVARQAR
jgi:ceramide glucosyltransferase